MKFDLDVYDRMALNMKAPKVAIGNTKNLTKLPDDFEPRKEDLEHNNIGEEQIGNIIP